MVFLKLVLMGESTTMKMRLLDKSECFRAFLLLIGRDKSISTHERKSLLEIGRILGFENRFCETSIDDLLENKYINADPPKFSHVAIAETFLRDAINVAFADDKFNTEEVRWLESIAVANGLSEMWLHDEISRFCGEPGQEGFALRIGELV